MILEPLLAKSKPQGQTGFVPEITLTGHTACVLAAVEALFGLDRPTRLARSWLRFFGLGEADFGRFLKHVRVAAAAHDWGKANDGFQDAVTIGGKQAVRHEHLSGLLLAEVLADARSEKWLVEAGIDPLVLLSAVISHHTKAAPERSYEVKHTLGATIEGSTRDSVRFRSDHDDFWEVWRIFQAEVGSDCPATIRMPGRWDLKTIREKSEKFRNKLDKARRRLREEGRWVAGVKSALIVADALGSAIVRVDREAGETALESIRMWVGDGLVEVLTGQDIWGKVTQERINELRAKKRWNDESGHEFEGTRGFSAFQCEVAAQGPRVLLTAACGSGKTLAAWNWIKTQIDARRPDEPISRVLFLYPTRATATEGFRDYVSWAPQDEAGLLSGTADYELPDMFDNPADPGDVRKGRNYQADPRLYALGHWKTKRIISATADQFFPFMQYAYGPLCMLPLLVESILVVDEVHSFDESMFNTLRRFLKEFPSVPVLCMTATLSEERRGLLEIECGLRAYSQRETVPEGEKPDSDYPRYRVKWIDPDEARWLVGGALKDDKRVLWVSNRVADCQATFDRFRDDEFTLSHEQTAFCYHSRFKLADRKDRHKELIGAFQDAVQHEPPLRAVFGSTTQVCEMSLDLDAEILVSELAPIAALIQRMGRCNRDSRKMRGRPIGRVYILRPELGKELPYEKDEVEIARKFVDELDGRNLSQTDLEQIYKRCDPGGVEPEKLCPFLDSGAYADGQEDSFRDTDEFTVPCILDTEETAVLAALQRKKSIEGYIVPVPHYLALKRDPEKSKLPRWLGVASMSRYDRLKGFDGTPPSKDGGQQP